MINPLGPLQPGRPTAASRSLVDLPEGDEDGWAGSTRSIQPTTHPVLREGPTFAPGSLSPTGERTGNYLAGSLLPPSIKLYDLHAGGEVEVDLSLYPLAASRKPQDLHRLFWNAESARQNLPSLEKILASFENPDVGMRKLTSDLDNFFPQTSYDWGRRQPRLNVSQFMEAYPYALAVSRKQKDEYYRDAPNVFLHKAVELGKQDALPVLMVAAGTGSVERAARLWAATEPKTPELASALGYALGRCAHDEEGLKAARLMVSEPLLGKLAPQVKQDSYHLPYQLRGLKECLEGRDGSAQPWALKVINCGAYWDEKTASRLLDFILIAPEDARDERAEAIAKVFQSRSQDQDVSAGDAARSTLTDLELLDSLRGPDQSLSQIADNFLEFRKSYGRDWGSLIAREEFQKEGLHHPEHFQRFQHYLPLCQGNKDRFDQYRPACQAAALEGQESPLYDPAERREILTRLMEWEPRNLHVVEKDFEAVTARKQPVEQRLALLGKFKKHPNDRGKACEMLKLVDGLSADAVQAAELLFDTRVSQDRSWDAPRDLAAVLARRGPEETFLEAAERLASIVRHPQLQSVGGQLFQWAEPGQKLEFETLLQQPGFQETWGSEQVNAFKRAPDELGAAAAILSRIPKTDTTMVKLLGCLLDHRPEGEPLATTAERFGRLIQGLNDPFAARERWNWMGSSSKEDQERLAQLAQTLPRQHDAISDAYTWLKDRPEADFERMKTALTVLQELPEAQIASAYETAAGARGDRPDNVTCLTKLLQNGLPLEAARHSLAWLAELPGELYENGTTFAKHLELHDGDVERAKATFKPQKGHGVQIATSGVTVGGVRLRTRSSH